uniref:RRM domain-containing protein n=1 Tax=Euplotes harpa TaxID=151035 RepID=A0A7S3JHP7_9SPIT|mmetsp:Transcript_37920/g.43550  ORF Transcript_37920/g.43550 Transcript_37920/m.43550 type:complete len:121 (+) Transcript_37920:35-397(+)|eukprot:CAMPEP_0168350736 /NCGR_PEP_ID=MMETSP0213-20121227/21344_1 /TAXON_ID=151035 /ORGANISM="Euplotes harpa, Strain FSP1.4" /LENGTH=120 /DNA_ID=CAMNT_0008361235 /DNA_START=14 /DNA_END=376 /DNA_ORIENTATION=+
MSNRLVQITNLPEKLKEEYVQAAFIPFGDCTVEIPREKGKHKGYALVQFEDEEDAEHAIFNMNNSEFLGSIIRVAKAKKKWHKDTFSKPVWKVEEEKQINYDEKHMNDEKPEGVLTFDKA